MIRGAALVVAALTLVAGGGASMAAPAAVGPPAAPGVGPGAVSAKAGPARPAESGGRDTAATRGPLAIGAAVKDRTGAEIGHIAVLTTDKTGRSIAKVRQGDEVFEIPVADLYARDGGAFSTVTLDDLRHGRGAVAAGGAR